MSAETAHTASPQFLAAPDGHSIALRLWQSENPRGVVHWLHGMAEHSGRYGALAEALNAAGWHLCVHDHRGHGHSVSTTAPRGHFADTQGWQRVVDDVTVVQHWLRKRFPGLPAVLGGHSMGSFVALGWAEQHAGQSDTALTGLVLCGSDYSPSWFYQLARLPILLERRRRGPHQSSPLIHAMTFGAWAKTLKQRHTEFDWLSRDPDEVRAYINDPDCGFDCTTQLWSDLMGGLLKTHSKAALKQLPDGLPLLLIAGDSDPMSRHGKGMRALERALRRTGAEKLTFQPYAGARHEILNDYCRDEVQALLQDWLGQL